MASIRLEMTDADFVALWRYARDHRTEVPELQRLYEILDDKLERCARRQLYTSWKNAPTPEEREKARQEYLDSIGMRPDWRY